MKIEIHKKRLTAEERQAAIHQRKVQSGELPTPEQEVERLKSLSSALTGSVGEEDADGLLMAASINEVVKMFAQSLPEDQALKVAAVYPRWRPNVEYNIGEIVRYGLNADNEPQIFRVAQMHTSQPDWKPDLTPALFTKLGFTEEGTAVWIQPLGTHDAYEMGDVVSHKGKLWESTANGNVWEPGVYGWKEITGAQSKRATPPKANSKK